MAMRLLTLTAVLAVATADVYKDSKVTTVNRLNMITLFDQAHSVSADGKATSQALGCSTALHGDCVAAGTCTDADGLPDAAANAKFAPHSAEAKYYQCITGVAGKTDCTAELAEMNAHIPMESVDGMARATGADTKPDPEPLKSTLATWKTEYAGQTRIALSKLTGYCAAVKLANQIGIKRGSMAGGSKFGATLVQPGMACEDLDTEVFMWVLPAIIGAAIGVVMVVYFYNFVINTKPGNDGAADEQLRKVAEYVHAGAVAFLNKEYQWLAVFVLLLVITMAVLFSILDSQDDLAALYVCICIVVGSVFSAGAGYLGMHVATKANIRTAHACREGLGPGLDVAFRSGAVMGLSVTSLGLIGLIVFTLAYSDLAGEWNYIAGFGMGASAIALFARVGGGIYTKAADVGADLVGKVENNIPEDDARNPAVIADNVGDNVGDVAGMGADLFESYAGSVIAACTLAHHNLYVNMQVLDAGLYFNSEKFADCHNLFPGATHMKYFLEEWNAYRVHGFSTMFAPEFMIVEKKIPYLEMDLAFSAMALPFWIAGIGIVCSIIGIFVVRTGEAEEDANKTEAQKRQDDLELLEHLLWITRYGVMAAGIFVVGGSIASCFVLFGDSDFTLKVFFCILTGLLSGIIIGGFTEYCTSYSYRPTASIAEMSDTGPATVIIQGMGVGMISCVVPTIVLLIAVVLANSLGGVYGIAVAAVGMLSTLGVTLATDAYGPVADNAGGLAEMCECEEIVRERTDALDALGNTTAATGKGFAIGSAVLTSVGLVAAYMEETGLQAGDVDLQNANVLVGILFGAMLPFLFGALTMLSVGRAAEQIIFQVRKQFEVVMVDIKSGVYVDANNEPKTWETWTPADLTQKAGASEQTVIDYYNDCIKISTEASLWEMLIPGIMACFAPAIIGFILGAPALAGLLVGALTSGFMLAITMANAGGAWDNAKKYCEKGGLGEGKGKNTDNHSACVVGDTVGDPFKDTSGPALNILIKLMSIVSLVLAPVFKSCCQEGFSTSGLIAGFVIFIVATLICVMIQRYMDKTNAAWKKDILATSEARRAAEARDQKNPMATIEAKAADVKVSLTSAPAAVVPAPDTVSVTATPAEGQADAAPAEAAPAETAP